MMDVGKLLDSFIQKGILVSILDGDLKVKAAKGVATAEDIELIRENKQKILDYFSAASVPGQDRVHAGPVTPVSRDGSNRFVLSFPQQRLWFIDRLQEQSCEYNMPMALKVAGPFCIETAQRAISEIIRRHEPLRTVFVDELGEPFQLLLEDFQFELKVVEMDRTTNLSEREDIIRSQIMQDAHKPFDLSQDLMLRASFIQLKKGERGEGVLIFNMHHVATDGWSMEILKREFLTLYQALRRHEAAQLPHLQVQYVDFAHWQREWLDTGILNGQIEYWQKQLAEVPQSHKLRLDYSRPPQKRYFGRLFTADRIARLDDLQQYARINGVTVFMLLHGALSLVLSRHSNTSDIVIGTPVANRQRPELEALIGFFVNTVVLRTNTSCYEPDVYWQHIRKVNIEAQANQDLPFEYLLEHLNVERSSSYSPLFQIMLTLDAGFGAGVDQGNPMSEVEFTPIVLNEVAARFDLSINAYKSGEYLAVAWEYDADIFSESHIQQLSAHMECLLTNMIRQPSASLDELDMLPQQERRYLLQELNQTRREYSADKQIHELFEAQVRQTPGQVAVQFDSTELSYQQLNERANQLAGYLRQHGVGTNGIEANSLVGLGLERSIDMVIAIVAVLKAGGAYVPLDPDYPFARIEYMAGEAELSLVLTQNHLAKQYRALANVSLVELDSVEFNSQLDGFSTENLPRLSGQEPANLAYVIYTSGSTGTPKGVMVPHQALVNRIEWMQNAYQLNPQDKVLQKTPFSFDVSVWEFLWPLSYGATMVVARPAGHKDPVYLSELIESQSVTVMHFVPSMLELYLKHDQSRFSHQVRYVFCSGEALVASQVLEFHRQAPNAQLHNLYGPTEAAIDVTYFHCRQEESCPSVPIGRPIQNIELFVLDAAMRLCPAAAEGELYIGGVGLASGYLNQPALTAERFVEHPFSPGEKLYKTGDLVRYRADGNLEYLGRLDDQVKLRGFRIELGEITEQLNACAEVASGLARVCQSPSGDPQLVAYIVPAQAGLDEQQLNEVLRSRLQANLPEYMVPSIFVVMDAFPLTANGKINYKALPEPGYLVQAEEYEAPRNEVEKDIVFLWSELLLLDKEKISRNQHFFRSGGHSLLSVKLVAKINKKYELSKYSISVFEVFENPVLSDMAEMIRQNKLKEKNDRLHVDITSSGVVEEGEF